MRPSVVALGRNAIELLTSLPKHGVGARLARRNWRPDCHWEVSEVRVAQDGRRGDVYGTFTWYGHPQTQTRARGVLKGDWHLLGAEPAPRPAPSAASALLTEERAAARAAARASKAEAGAAEAAAPAPEA